MKKKNGNVLRVYTYTDICTVKLKFKDACK